LNRVIDKRGSVRRDKYCDADDPSDRYSMIVSGDDVTMADVGSLAASDDELPPSDDTGSSPVDGD